MLDFADSLREVLHFLRSGWGGESERKWGEGKEVRDGECGWYVKLIKNKKAQMFTNAITSLKSFFKISASHV